MAEPKPGDSISDKDVRAPNMIERAKEGIEAFLHFKKSPEHHHHHHKETHGTSEDIDKDTPVGEVKAPNVFERAKEEVEAIVQAIHPKKELASYGASPKKESGGPFASIGRSVYVFHRIRALGRLVPNP